MPASPQAGICNCSEFEWLALKLVSDLIRAKTLETHKHIVEITDVVLRYLTNSLYPTTLALIKVLKDIRGGLTFVTQANPDQTPICF